MIERGVLRIEDGKPTLMSVPIKHQKAETLSEAMFNEGLAKVDPGLPAALRDFLQAVEPLGVYADLKASLNLKVDLPDRPKPINFGYIAKNGQLWTNPFSWTAPEPISQEYNARLAGLIGGSVSKGKETSLTINGKSAPNLAALLPRHAGAWADIIRWAIDALRNQDAVGTP